MFCTIYRWLISRSMDSPGPLPARVAGHAERCEACKAYRDNCLSLADRLVGEAEEMSDAVSDDLHARILLRCGIGAGAAPPRPEPVSHAGRLKLGLAAAAVAAAIIIAALAVWRYSPDTPQDPNTPDVDPGRLMAAVLTESPRVIVESAAKVNSAFDRSIDKELDDLRDSGLTAADFVLARMPIDIDILE